MATKQLAPLEGVKKIIMMRLLANDAKEEGKRLSLQTTHTITRERKSNDTATKDGIINVFDPTSTSMDMELIGSDDPLFPIIKNAATNGGLVEIWEIDFNLATSDGKYKATYMQGEVSSFEESNDSDDFSKVKVEFTINGIPQDGEVALKNDVVEGIQYAFRDTKKATTGV